MGMATEKFRTVIRKLNLKNRILLTTLAILIFWGFSAEQEYPAFAE